MNQNASPIVISSFLFIFKRGTVVKASETSCWILYISIYFHVNWSVFLCTIICRSPTIKRPKRPHLPMLQFFSGTKLLPRCVFFMWKHFYYLSLLSKAFTFFHRFCLEMTIRIQLPIIPWNRQFLLEKYVFCPILIILELLAFVWSMSAVHLKVSMSKLLVLSQADELHAVASSHGGL